MKIAEDDEEKKIKLPIMKYYKYMLHQKDDSPLYMFQSGFNDLEGTEDIIKNYKVPPYFKEDFFNYVMFNHEDE
jgi:histone arginine demethylase JMJD6